MTWFYVVQWALNRKNQTSCSELFQCLSCSSLGVFTVPYTVDTYVNVLLRDESCSVNYVLCCIITVALCVCNGLTSDP